MFQNFLIKKMLKAQNVPDDLIEMLMGIVEKNPGVFQKMVNAVKQNMDTGMSQQDAMNKVMTQYAEEIKKLQSR